ncbi:thioredoxin-like protein, partial [Schizophyllum amplum]
RPAGADSVPPRRSSRNASQVKEDKPAPVKKPSSTKGSKRTAEGEASTREAKKAKEEKDAETEDVGDKPAPIDIGGNLPSLTLKNEKDEDVDVGASPHKKGSCYFWSPRRIRVTGCTTQACGFRDVYPDFEKEDFQVYCVSADKPAAQAKWQAKKTLPYPLLSDPGRNLISALGAGKAGKTARSHFVFEKGGKLLDKKMPVKPADSPRLALEFVRSLKAQGGVKDGGEADMAKASEDGGKDENTSTAEA